VANFGVATGVIEGENSAWLQMTTDKKLRKIFPRKKK